MKSIKLFIIFAIFCLFSSCDTSIEGSGVEKEKNIPITTDFFTIEASGNFTLSITQGSTYKVTIKGDDNLVENIEFKESSKKLEISQLKDYTKGKVAISIICPDLDKIILNNFVSLVMEQKIITNKLELIAVDYSKASVTIQSNDLEVKVANSAAVKLSGNANTFNATTRDQSKLNATIVIANLIDVEALGQSGVHFSGKSNKLTVTTKDQAQFDASTIMADIIDADASGQSYVQLSPIQEFILDASDQAVIKFNEGLYTKRIAINDQAQALVIKDTIKEIPVDGEELP